MKTINVRINSNIMYGDRWYKGGEIYAVLPEPKDTIPGGEGRVDEPLGFTGYFLPGQPNVCIQVEECEVVSDMLNDKQRQAINVAFGKMRFMPFNFDKLTAEDDVAESINKLIGNLETLNEMLKRVAAKGNDDEATLQNHRSMFKALGGLMAEIERASK